MALVSMVLVGVFLIAILVIIIIAIIWIFRKIYIKKLGKKNVWKKNKKKIGVRIFLILTILVGIMMLPTMIEKILISEICTNKQCEKILNCILQEDEDALRALFADEYIEEITDFEMGFSYVENLLQGEILKVERTGVHDIAKFSYRGIYYDITAVYEITTVKDEYTMCFLYSPKNEKEKKGIYSLALMKNSEKENDDRYYKKIPGIYYPGCNRKGLYE